MNTVLNRTEFAAFVKRAESDESRYCLPAFRRLMFSRFEDNGWVKALGTAKSFIIEYIAHTTLRANKPGSRIHMAAMTGHLPLNEKTIRAHLAELVRDGYVHVFGMKDIDHSRYSEAKFYGINLSVFNMKGVDLMSFLHAPKKVRTPSSQNRYAMKDSTKVELCNEKQTLSRPPARSPSGAVAEAIERAEQRHATAVARKRVKAAATPTGLMTTLTLQFELDALMAKYHPSLPRVIVTSKEFGAFRKRLSASGIKDRDHFIDWLIRSWGTLARKQNDSVSRQLRNGDGPRTGWTPMPLAPSIKAMGYRFNYFAAVYASALAGREVVGTDEKDAEIATLRKALAAKGKELNVVRNLRRTVPATAPRIARENRAAFKDGFEDWDEANVG